MPRNISSVTETNKEIYINKKRVLVMMEIWHVD